MRQSALILLGVFIAVFAYATDPTKSDPKKIKSYTTKWVEGTPPIIDGLLNEPAWEEVEWSGDFIQWQPNEGKAPSQNTLFKILYDDKNLYIAIKAIDTDPGSIVQRMGRRDQFDGDWVEVNIDSYNDKRTAFSFTASAAGVKGDEYITSDGQNWDPRWDPIWYLKTSLAEDGWIAEMQIPLSQLRFGDKETHSWGLQVQRRFFREEERSLWQTVPAEGGGWVRYFGELNGLTGIKSQNQVEIQPYIVAKIEDYEKEDGNPFATGSDYGLSAGLDGKIGITSDVTLDFTINPDFGQVEADPSQVNLTAFQVFFQEQRPFFLEGMNILSSQLSNSVAGGQLNSDNIFYSRRIGGRPHYFPELADGQYVDMPDNTRILGAFKLTGKNKQGFSYGVMESVTRREMATIDDAGSRSEVEVEPLTNYLVGRVQQDWNQGNTIIGGIFTSTNRDLDNPNMSFLHKSAYSAGTDFLHNWKDKTYYVSGGAYVSNVTGTKEAIYRTQTAGEHFFQREGVDHVTLDSTITSLSGTSGTLVVGKTSGKFVFQTGGTYRSPGFEINDIGFLMSADRVNQWSWAQYRILKPFSIFNSIRINGNQYLNFDFSGTNTYRAINFNAHAAFKNQWRFGGGGTAMGENISTADLRGGPAMLYPRTNEFWYYLGSDRRKKIYVNLNQWAWAGAEGYAKGQGLFLNVTWRPMDALNIRLSPNFNLRQNEQQYVDTQGFAGSSRYITAKIDQKTYNMSMRVTYMINPNLSVQFWGQPFASKASYSNFKYITDSQNESYESRFVRLTDSQVSLNSGLGEYAIDEDLDGTTDYSISNPDFNFVQFRANLVLRWEYKPGSTAFLVWNQGRTGSPEIGEEYNMGQLANELFDVRARNIFLLKYTYRFIL